MLTLRQHLEAIASYWESCPAAVMEHVGAALDVLDASSTMAGALQTDVYRVVADDPHRAPERIAR